MLFKTKTLERYFMSYRKNITGIQQRISTPYHKSIPILYADWTASGRSFAPIEDRIQEELLPFVANTHTETSDTGLYMTHAYHVARKKIKAHVNASNEDVLINCGSGMTGAVNKLQRILGIKLHERFKSLLEIEENDRPIVFVTHLEHHSNHTSWLETIADVEVIAPCEKGIFDFDDFERKIEKYKNRKLKIAAISACSNVTGVLTPLMDIAQTIHNYGGVIFADFACSAPYVNINMHENDAQGRYLDALMFSPHKFLGGPGSSGVLIFNQKLYHNHIPDHPGGGTVQFTDPWQGRAYFDDIEEREDGGTPAFLQTIRTAMCIALKEEMGVENILQREEEIMELFWKTIDKNENIIIYEKQNKTRLGVISFNIKGLPHQLGVRILNDMYGIQARGGCSCAGTYGHYLLSVDQSTSKKIQNEITCGSLQNKPGWIRISFHPTFTDKEVVFVAEAINSLAETFPKYQKDYSLTKKGYVFKNQRESSGDLLKSQVEEVFAASFV